MVRPVHFFGDGDGSLHQVPRGYRSAAALCPCRKAVQQPARSLQFGFVPLCVLGDRQCVRHQGDRCVRCAGIVGVNSQAVANKTQRRGRPGLVFRLNTSNASQEPMERLGIVQRFGKLDPRRRRQKVRKIEPLSAGSGKQNRDNSNGARLRNSTVDRSPHFLVLPRSHFFRTDEHHAGEAFMQRVFNRRLPRLTGNQVPLIEPRIQPFATESMRELLHGRLVVTAVRQESVKRRCRAHGDHSMVTGSPFAPVRHP
jgi:hypothetical protein